MVFLSSLQGALFGLVSLGLRGRASSDGPHPEAGGGAWDGPANEAPAPGDDGQPVAGEGGGSEAGDAADRPTFTPEWRKPGLTAVQRVLAVPYVLLLQPIPDDPPDVLNDDGAPEAPEWTPGATSMPFGPWIGLAGLEVLLLTPWLRALFEGTPLSLMGRLLFGDGA